MVFCSFLSASILPVLACMKTGQWQTYWPGLNGTSPTCIHSVRYHTFNDKRLSSGCGGYGLQRQYFFVAPTANVNGYKAEITATVANWVNADANRSYPTPLSFRITETQQSSVVDFHKGILDPSTYGITEWYSSSGRLYDPCFQNWQWANIPLMKVK